ncbi:MAG: AMP-binding protein, partial [Glaciimonas sp.]|nr:AMP-binding protein [Glaciimonas sp.]
MANIETLSNETRIFPPAAKFAKTATISSMEAYNALCKEAATDEQGFWGRLAREHLQWQKPFTKVLDESNAPFYKWFEDGQLNVSYNCLDVHLQNGNANKNAIVFESDGGDVVKVTYQQLYEKVCKFANGLKSLGIKKGDRVVIYMPMSVEGVVAMQACARIGATHSVVFGGFSAKSLQERIIDAGAVAVLTADYQVRGGKNLPLKAIVDDALALGGCACIQNVIVYK